MERTAVLIDGGYFTKCINQQYGNMAAADMATFVAKLCDSHIAFERISDLYRIFYYDCAPLEDKILLPISRKQLDLGQTPLARYTRVLHKELLKVRKVALRLGELTLNSREPWVLKPRIQKELVSGAIKIEDLTDECFKLNVRQKGVDMRIGLDISSLAYKRQVSQIVLVSGDSDFVPVAKLARREGLDVVLDPLGRHVNSLLEEHIDGVFDSSMCVEVEATSIIASLSDVTDAPETSSLI